MSIKMSMMKLVNMPMKMFVTISLNMIIMIQVRVNDGIAHKTLVVRKFPRKTKKVSEEEVSFAF